jgi:heat shock protein HslJ
MSGEDEFARHLRERVDAVVPAIDVDTARVVPRARRRRAVVRSVGAVGVVALVVGTAVGAASLWPGRTTTNPPAATATPTPAVSLAPVSAAERLGLVDMWRVSADGEGSNTFLRLSGAEAIVFRDCGYEIGGWAAGPTMFVASISGWGDGCSDGDGAAVPWLEDASYYRADGDGWQLLDSSGAVLATLRHGGLPTPDPNLSADYAQAPVVDDAQRYYLGDPAALPAGPTAATADEVVGRWESTGSPVATNPYVEFGENRDWKGSDGCNDAAGRWAVDVDGHFLVTSGAHTEIGCDGAPLPDLLVTARRLAFRGDVLVFLDADGAEVMELARSGATAQGSAPGPTPTSAGATPTAGAAVSVTSVTSVTCTDAGPVIAVDGGAGGAGPQAVAASDGVHLLVSSATSAPEMALDYRRSGEGGGVSPVTAKPSEVVLDTLSPGEVQLRCLDPSGPDPGWQGAITLTVVDPNGYWNLTSPQKLGCWPGGQLDMAIPPEAIGRATAREAVEGLAAGLGLAGTVTAEPVSAGYADAPTPTWLVYRDGVPYATVAVTNDDGRYSAGGEAMCVAP